MDTELAWSGILSVAVFGFTGSLHCAAMCGTLAASACGLPRQGGVAIAQYHATRMLAYAFLGLLTGLLSALTLGRWFAEQSRWLAVVLGCMTIVYGLNEWRRAAGGRGFATASSGPFGRGLRRLHSNIQAWPLPRPVLLGLTTALLPCGFLGAALMQSALLANPVLGALAMAAFAIASAPALAVGGSLLRVLAPRWPRVAPYLASFLLLAAGASMLFRAWHVHVHHHQ